MFNPNYTNKQGLLTFIFVVALSLSPIFMFAQSADLAVVHTSESNPIEREASADENIVSANREAVFTGGEVALHTYLKTHVEYPEIARNNNLEGTAVIRFKVLADGSLAEFQVKQSAHTICDKAVIAALQQMPKWTPARSNGTYIPMWREVEVDFSISNY